MYSSIHITLHCYQLQVKCIDQLLRLVQVKQLVNRSVEVTFMLTPVNLLTLVATMICVTLTILH